MSLRPVPRLGRARDLIGLTGLNFILLGIIPNLASDFVKQHVLVGAVIAGGIAASYALLTGVVTRIARRSRTGLALTQRERPRPRRGLIVIMSPGDRVTPAESAIKVHLAALEHCWIVSGPDHPTHRPTSSENARTIAARYEHAKEAGVTFHLKSVPDGDNPQASYHIIRSIFEEAKAFGVSARDLIADYTGGTKSMTAGMILACSLSDERDAQYMKATTVTTTGGADRSTESIAVLIDLHFGEAR